MFKNLGPMELLILVLVIVVFFGGKKIPELMHGLGKGINEFKRGQAGGDEPTKTPEPTAPKA